MDDKFFSYEGKMLFSDLVKNWDEGKYLTSKLGIRLINKKPGQLLNDAEIFELLKKCTICPVGNGSCHNFIALHVYGFNPDKGGKTINIMLCTDGVKDTGEDCHLNK